MDQQQPQHTQQPNESIAIVGSACRFPGASSSPSRLWELLRQPRDVLKEFDPERLTLQRFYHPNGDTHGATDVQNKSYILEEDTRLFDASFFGISPVEAAGMDPQQRILLETVYEVFESAGMTLEELRGSLTSVHVGCMTSDYATIQSRDTETVAKYNATGSANSILSNRISYIFDLKGPSETIDTACSSSLVALHNAARGLLSGDCDTAIVAGVNLIFDPAPYINESKLHMLSPDARSRMWDKSANGYARGEGAGALLLKRLDQALKDGDHIEGIVRGTGVNSDGQSPGITMPFAPTQTALIRHTYARAGLDPVKDRPQYIECHGTGTPAGDPVEARALSDAFVGGQTSFDDPIYVGSIKTVIGHLEGGAGLAGVIKVLLGLKHRVIPPNLLFKELNPALRPFYGPLQIPTTAIPWPNLPPGVPARASVNSFGFGGTNAHVIIESFDNESVLRQDEATPESAEGVPGPLLFSAKSGASLLRTVQAHLEHLEQHPSLDVRDLSSLLQTRRSTHRVRAHFSGSSREAILERLTEFVKINENAASNTIGHQPQLVNPKEVSGILGVFTGQGAQWPTMGRELVEKSPLFRQTLEECQAVLQELPENDRPEWSLMNELTVEASSSRVSEAAISQPLCTAIQLALLNLLKAAGISFDAAVGHSSGEIAATYAAGIITVKGAMQIAYYRGLHARNAGGSNGERGGMLAAGLSIMEAREFCNRSEFSGCIKVAASNAPKSVTLSGDLDAITKAHELLQVQNTFSRQLKVDTAYHSHHMQPCAEPYLQSLLACDIEVRQPTGRCTWISSVRGDTQLLKGDLSTLKGQYWVDNMVRTVLFTHAIESSIWHGGPFDLAIEVGPHPALKGPTEQTMKASYGSVPVHTGVLKRGGSDIEAFSTAIGVAWSQLGLTFVDFVGYRNAFYETQPLPPKVLKDLPPYSWDHDKVYWREGRLSRRFRLGKDQCHELLGRRTPDDNESELRWRNVLKLSEIPWLSGHEVLGEVLLPGASYVSIAVEAGKSIANGKPIRMIEVENVHIIRPVVVPDNTDGVETLFTARLTETTKERIRAKFSYYVCPDEAVGSMLQTCRGDLCIDLETQLHAVSEDLLPLKELTPPNLTSIDTERVYSLFKDIGLNYSGYFRGISAIDRCLNYASTTSIWTEGLSDGYVVHPAMLDVAFQTMFIAKAHPASRQISSALLPSHIDRVRINPSVPILQPDGAQTTAEFETWAVTQTATSLIGDLNIYDATTSRTFLQVEGLAVNAVGEQDASQDRSMFSKTVWANDASLGVLEPPRDPVKDSQGLRMAHAVERVALFYVKRIVDQIDVEERKSFQWYHQRMFEAFEEHLKIVKDGEHPIILSEWLDDEPSVLDEINAEHGDTIDLKLLHAVGKDLADVVRGKKQMLEVMTKDDMLNRFYMEGYASVPTNKSVGEVMKQLTYKFPRTSILEIGAGTGGTTWSVLNAIDNSYDSYTYTDVSSGFFPTAEEKFSKFVDKMMFKVLDIEKEPAEQGFAEHSYDIIVAALVLHATHDLEKTMRHARSLLKPGGYLMMVELTGTMSVRATFIMGGLPGWWLGENDGRRLSPLVTSMEWDRILQDTGFSGCDTVIHDLADEDKHCTALIVSQAVDDDFQHLRAPLATVTELSSPIDPLLIIGGKRLSTSKIMREIQKLFPRQWERRIRYSKSIDDVDVSKLTPGVDVICLHDADEPLFANTITASRMAIFQSLLMNAKNMLWVIGAGKSHVPRANLIHGIMRVVPSELPHLNVQVLGLETGEAPAVVARHCTETFLRLRAAGATDGNTSNMLWMTEPELEILASGETVIPRVIPDVAINELYNASKRAITKAVDATDIAVQAVPRNDKMVLQVASTDNGTDGHRIRVDVRYALHIPGQGGNSLYLVCGKAESSWAVAISNSNASVLNIEPSELVTIDEHECTPGNLAGMADFMFTWSIANLAAPASSVLLYEVEDSLADMVTSRIATQGGKAFFASSKSDASGNCIKIHALASKRTVQRAVPRDVQLYIDCSDGTPSASSTLRMSMAAGCRVRQLDQDLLQEAFRAMQKESAELVQESYTWIKESSSSKKSFNSDIIEASQLAGANSSSLMRKRHVIDWRKRDSLTITVQPLNLEGLFRPDMTYFMAGMAGGLGLSICQWMIRNGAKHMVITSRNPQVDQVTLDEARHAGASVQVFPMDLTNKASIESVVRQVHDTMPPIAGVCNAAMVLKDGFFIDMDVDQFNNTLAAKVLGSEHLDAIFANTPLDFFILLGSVASVIGNVGQSNYHAANLFMTSLVAQRRSRGLAASIIHIAYVTDVGYVTREERDRQLDSHFRKVRLMPTSETDVHHAFAEAVRGGKPGSFSGSHDIIMGIEPLNEPIPLDQQPVWLKNPRFAHFAQHTVLHAQQERTTGGSSGNVRGQVDEAKTEEEAISAVMVAFCGKLESILQLSFGSINVQRPITDLGIDSLVAVEIRTWFLKELGADVPVVKILGGDTVLQLSTTATKKLLAKNMEADAAKSRDTTPADTAIPTPTSSQQYVLSSQVTTGSCDVSSSTGSSSDPVITVSRADSDQLLQVVSKRGSESDNASVLTATSRQEGSVTSISSYNKAETEEADTTSDISSVSAHGESEEEKQIKPDILREERMSPAQSRIWFLSKHLEDATSYNMAFRYRVKGSISIARLRHALSVTTHNHESLRMCFYSRLEDGHLVQGVMPSSLYKFNHITNAEDIDANKEMARLATRQWDLEHGHTFEVVLLSRNSEEHDLIIAYHHIIMDVVGFGVILQDLNKAYLMQALERTAGSYIEYSTQQLKQQSQGAFDEHLTFWQTEFETLPENLPRLPFAHINNRLTTSGRGGHHVYRELKEAQFTGLKATCQRLRISPFHFHLSILQILLARYAKIEDMCIGIVDANRNDHRFATTVGCFVNMVPVRLRVPADAAFADIARRTSKKALEALSNSAVPFDMILDHIKVPRSSDRTPLFQVALNYRTGSIWEMPLGEAKMDITDVKDANNPYDISLGIAETRTGCIVEIYGLSSMYGEEACNTMLDSYMRLLSDFVNNSDMQINMCNIHDEFQVSHALQLGTGPKMDFGWPSTLSQRFLDIAHIHASHPAITDKTLTLSYSDLVIRMHTIADAIIRRGCNPGDNVAVLCEPSMNAVAAMLAVLHVGGVYVPLDVSLPTARHAAMVKSCSPSLILTHSATESHMRDLVDEVGLIEEVIVDTISGDSCIELPCSAKPDTYAVLLFTSGSTGTPKGILLSQASFVNHLALKTHMLRLGQGSVLQQSSLAFDMSLIQTFCALANGGRLVIAPYEMRRDPIEMTGLVGREQISLTIATPSEYLAWTRYGPDSLKQNKGWRHACMGGEPVTQQLMNEFRRLGLDHLKLTNCYGPTEITAAATFQTIRLEEEHGEGDDRAKYAVGKALPNYSVSILDASGQPQPVNHTGEICIGGAGVALGYLNGTKESQQKFMTTELGRQYRTGDRGCLMSDGTLLCLGRIDGDTQIKLRGLRIDLQEVEAALVQVSGGLLSTVIVSQRGDVLIAHATLSVGTSEDKINEAELTRILGQLKLPQYFIPASVIVLPTLPTNANGKLDRKAIAALPLPESVSPSGTLSGSHEEKMTVREGELRLLWERVLPSTTITRIAPSSDFFLLGGNSLLLMKLQAALKDSMNVFMSTRTLYQASTLREMARCIEKQREEQAVNDPEKEIDWAAETAIPKWLLSQIRKQPGSTRKPKSTKSRSIEVLMTGATGFLGGHLLNSLIHSSNVRRVHCIAVLADDQNLLPADDKVECYTGSLLSPTLGLTIAERQHLEETVDVVVHAGANGHCLNTYASLRTPNLLSTQFLASLALPRSIPLLFLSSNRVVLLSGNTAPPPGSVAAFPPLTDGREGHMMSKWASEAFLENLVNHMEVGSRQGRQTPWTVSVHRPAVIVSDQAPNSDALNAILRYSLLMQCAPRMDRVAGYLDLAQSDKVVEELSQEVVRLALAEDNSPNPNGRSQDQSSAALIRFQHHSGGVKVPANELWSHLENVHGVRFEEVEISEWMARAEKAGIDRLITAYLEGVQNNGATMVFPFMGEGSG